MPTMGFEQLAFSIAHLGLLHSLPAKWLRLDLWLRLVLRPSPSCGGESYSHHWSAA